MSAVTANFFSGASRDDEEHAGDHEGHEGHVLLRSSPDNLAGGSDGRWDLSANYAAAVLQLALDRTPEPGGPTADPLMARRPRSGH